MQTLQKSPFHQPSIVIKRLGQYSQLLLMFILFKTSWKFLVKENHKLYQRAPDQENGFCV